MVCGCELRLHLLLLLQQRRDDVVQRKWSPGLRFQATLDGEKGKGTFYMATNGLFRLPMHW